MSLMNSWSLVSLSLMPLCHSRPRSLFFWFILVTGLSPFSEFGVTTPFALASDRPILHHNLTIQILPDTHEILAQDTIILKATDWPKLISPLRLSLNRNLTVDNIQIGTKAIHFAIVGPSGDIDEGKNLIHFIEISDWEPLSPDTPLSLLIRYKGKIHDPPRSSKDLRFVRPDKTLGHIGSEGIYLTSETAWYPDLPETLSTFHVQVTLPEGWMSVTQGQLATQASDPETVTATWDVDTPSEALTLVANHFVKHQRDWHGIKLETYLFPEDSHLSALYLDATGEYLEVYTKLLGPYPFRKFAVVENFFPSGIGLPSYTLLGSRVIKRGYTQPYSLGHEIVHSWLGNSVLNDFTKGNWVEGLTTYLANYYYEELQGHPDTLLQNRRRMLYEYNLYAPASEEYPLVQFHHKETRIDNAIGYQKAAMVFHMLRREIGDDAFFSGIRALVKERSGAYADWGILEQAFEKTAGQELGWFFTQWVEQRGAPLIRIISADVHPDQNPGGGSLIGLTLEQTTPVYQLNLPVTIELTNGKIFETSIMLTTQKPTVTVPIPTQPTRLLVDPTFEIFRRLQRDQIPPMLNKWVTDQNPLLILPDESFRKDTSVYQPILHRLQSRELHVNIQPPDEEMNSSSHSQLILDDPQTNYLTSKVLESCHDDMTLGPKGLTIRHQTFEGPKISWLISCPHPTHPEHTLTVFSGFSASAITPVARLLFFYGWDSYLVFNNGKVVTRGTLKTINKDLEVSLPAA